MKKLSDRHRRRLFIVQSEYDHSEQAPSAPSDEAVALAVPKEIALPEKAILSKADPGLLKSSPVRSGFKIAGYTTYFRHILAVAFVASLGYFYIQYQQPDETAENSSVQVDPFSDWKNVAEAPTFNTQAVSQSENGIPMPISLASENSNNLPDILDDTSSWVESGNLSNQRKRSLSLWEEPGISRDNPADQKVESIASIAGDSLSTHRVNRNHQHQKNSHSKDHSLSENVINDQAQNSQGKQRAIPSVAEESWRQFTLGSGSQKIVCVIDETVTGDSLLLSTIFTGIRREWVRDVARSSEQQLVLLIANRPDLKELPEKTFSTSTLNSKQRQIELQRKIDAADPMRIVYLSQGKERRGRLGFSSEEESVAALLSVPGMYRITSLSMRNGFSPKKQKQQIVHIELPFQAQDSTTSDLLFTALSGSWNSHLQEGLSGYHASRDASGKTPGKKAVVQGKSRKESLQSRQKKKQVEILPSPFASRREVASQQKSKQNSFYKLPPAPVPVGD